MNLLALCLCLMPQETVTPPATPDESIRAAGRLIGLEFTDSEIELMRGGVSRNRELYLRAFGAHLDNGVAPVLGFDPLIPGVRAYQETLEPAARPAVAVERPERLADLVYADLRTLSALIRTRAVSCTELTQVYLDRLKEIDGRLVCVVELCQERALSQAAALDRELEEGHWRGPLHGIPWGAKDLLAVRGTHTTWGAQPFRDQVIDADAAVVEKLDQAGAILIAKLSLGALAWGDVWFGGTTKNPWKLDQGSSGSSAGPAAATAAGGVAFAIGSETCGSIVSPSARCGDTSLRPTFGRVSRRGAMALAWSMDKLGPICRSAADANVVFAAITGPDPLDESTTDRPFTDLGPQSIEGWRIGVLPGAEKDENVAGVLDDLRAMGAELLPVTWPEGPVPSEDILLVLWVEGATAFDEITRDGRDDELVRQVEMAWPNVFRVARLVPAVEYLRLNRLRRQLMTATDTLWDRVDVLVHATGDGEAVVRFNLTGNPSVCAPSGFRSDGTPLSVSFTGPLFSESRLLALCEAWQARTDHHHKHPDL